MGNGGVRTGLCRTKSWRCWRWDVVVAMGCFSSKPRRTSSHRASHDVFDPEKLDLGLFPCPRQFRRSVCFLGFEQPVHEVWLRFSMSVCCFIGFPRCFSKAGFWLMFGWVVSSFRVKIIYWQASDVYLVLCLLIVFLKALSKW